MCIRDRRTLESSGAASCESEGPLICEIFEKVSDAMTDMVIQGAEKTGVSDIIMAGGVTSSSFIRRRALKRLDAAGINAVSYTHLDVYKRQEDSR